MNIKSLTFGLALMASPALAETITDDLGRPVALPDQIERVVTLHDGLLAVPLHELGLDVVASAGRPGPDGSMVIAGFETLFGTTAKDEGIAYIGGYSGYDLELIKSLAPDLIIGAEIHAEQVDAMAAIAPFVIQQSFTGDVYGNSAVKVMAERLGRMAQYEALDAAYQARLAEVKAALPFDPAGKTYAAVLAFDQINMLDGQSGMVQALNDLGFERPDWVAALERRGFLAPISPEQAMNLLEVDLLFLMAGFNLRDQSEASTRAQLDKIVPGWDQMLKTGEGSNVIFTDSLPMVVPSFASAMHALDVVEAHYAQ